MPKIYWNKVKKRTKLPVVKTPPLDRVHVAKFASGINNFHPAYFDPEFAETHGYGGQCAHSEIAFHLIEEALIHFGENLHISTLSGTYYRLIHPGDVLETRCSVKKHYRKNGEARIDLECDVFNQRSEKIMPEPQLAFCGKPSSQKKGAEANTQNYRPARKKHPVNA